MARDVLVAGAGAFGLTTALALADAGCAVTVSDPAPPAANASGVAAGMLAPVFEAVLDVDTADHFDLLSVARDLWPALAARTGIDLDRAGALAVGSSAWLARVEAGIGGLGLRPVRLSGAAARDRAPGLSAACHEAVFTGDDWRLDAVAALAALRRACEGAGVRFRREAATGRGAADLLVVATGAAQDLAPELAALVPIKGHILRLAALGHGGAVVRAADGYAAPWSGGLVVGATMEAGVADPRVDPAKGAPLASLAGRLFPGVAAASGELQAGIRAATPDGLPMVGAGGAPGVLLAVGARRNGWLLAPLAARIIVSQAMETEPGVHAARLDPRRFSRA